MSDPKEEIGKIIDGLEERLKEEQIKNNRLNQENIKIKNSVARLIELFKEGDTICQMLKT